jgi:diacylglycerol O-acyltransferase / wax synthase
MLPTRWARHYPCRTVSERIPLTEEDLAILRLEGPTIAGHTCKVVLIEGEGVEFDQFFRLVAERIEGVPELRRRLHEEEGRCFWRQVETFRLEDHLTEAGGGRVLDEEEFDELITGVFSERLDRDRPLWKMDFARLKDGGRALIWRIHHTLADGSTAMRFAKEVLWDEMPEDSSEVPGSARQSKAHAVHTEESEKERRRHLAALFEREFARSHGPSPFDGRIGRERVVAFATVSLSSLHDSAKELAGATLNDAVLSVIAGSLRHWMELEQNDLVGDLRARVPVSLHRDGENLGNRDSFFAVPLHLDEPDPVDRLKLIRVETGERKADHDAEELDELTGRLGKVSSRLRHLMEMAEESPRRFAVSVSNVKGPREQVSVLGAAVGTVYSVVEIGEHHALRIAVVSTGDRLGFTFTADPHLIRDLEEMAVGVEVEARQLAELADLDRGQPS